jgi:hypothetical protein
MALITPLFVPADAEGEDRPGIKAREIRTSEESPRREALRPHRRCFAEEVVVIETMYIETESHYN